MEEVLFSDMAVMYALNVATATLAIGLVAILVARRSRQTSLRWQHGMLCIAVLVILASPVLVLFAVQRNLGLVTIDLFGFEIGELGEPVVIDRESFPLPNDPHNAEIRLPVADAVDLPGSTDAVAAPDVDLHAIDNRPMSFAELLADGSVMRAGLSIAGNLFLFVWGGGGVWFAGRLIYGLLVVRRLRRSLRPVTDVRLIESARQVFALAGMPSAARIAESPIAPAPLTLGWWRPVIVVPVGLAKALSDEQMSCIMAHELAHVRRRDTLIGLAQQMAAAAFWWNPFLHAVNRQINRLRERLCDDFAAIQEGQGVALAQALVRVAEWSAARTMPSPMTNGLLEDCRDLEERIQRLTEVNRGPLASRMNWKSALALGGFGVLLGMLPLLPLLRAEMGGFSGAYFGNVPDVTDDDFPYEPDVERRVIERRDGSNVQLSEPVPISLSGHVRTLEKRPVASVRVYLFSLHCTGECIAAREPHAVTQTDAEGRYEFRNIALPTNQFELSNQRLEKVAAFQVCGEMDGFGIAWNRACDYSPKSRPPNLPEDEVARTYYLGEAIEQNLTLRPARPLEGRIIDDRGEPVANAMIQLRELDYLDMDGHEWSQRDRAFDASLTLLPERFRQARTGADGRFEFNGLPDRSVVQVMITHPQFADQRLMAAITDTPITKNRYIQDRINTFDANDNDKPITVPYWRTRSVRSTPLEIHVRATRRVLVEVIHEGDGTPARGAGVSVSETGVNCEASSSDTTDEHGRAVLKLPPGKHRLFVFPNQSSADLLTKQELVVDDQPGEQTFKVSLPKGCTLTLEVVDADTGQGIADVSFMKVDANGRVRHSGFSTNDSGECRAIVEPGTHCYGISFAEGYANIDPFRHRDKKAVVCEAGKTARLQFRLRK